MANSGLATLPLPWVAEEFRLCTGCEVGLVDKVCPRGGVMAGIQSSVYPFEQLCFQIRLTNLNRDFGWMFSELFCQRARDVAPQGPGCLSDGEQLLRAAFCVAAIWDNSSTPHLGTLNCLCWLCGSRHTFPWSLWCAQEASALSERTT